MRSNISRRFLWSLLLAITGCSNDEKPQIERPMGEIYHKAFSELKDKRYESAFDEFTEVERQYPYSAWAAKAQLMAAYAAYKDQNFERAIGVLDNFMMLHPYHPQVSYAYYLRALCYYDDIAAVTKDPKVAESAHTALTELINRFPETMYAQDARFKRDYVLSHLAGKQMTIGRFYLYQKDYLAALLRFQNVVQQYASSPHTAEALHRVVECSLALGLLKEAKQTAAVLGCNFPQSPWYADTYFLMEGKDFRNPCTQDREKTLVDKIFE